MKFRARIELHGKTATGIVVPPEIVESLNGGKRPPVRVIINGHTYHRSNYFSSTGAGSVNFGGVAPRRFAAASFNCCTAS